MIVFRLALLYLVSYVGSVVYYSRKDLEPRRLLTYCLGRALVVTLWTIAAFAVMTLLSWAFIDSGE